MRKTHSRAPEKVKKDGSRIVYRWNVYDSKTMGTIKIEANAAPVDAHLFSMEIRSDCLVLSLSHLRRVPEMSKFICCLRRSCDVAAL
jgi:hypothetical protein